MRRFASLDPFLDTTDWNFRMGRPIANEGFLRALLTHGTFDEYRFYLPDVEACEQWIAQVQTLRLPFRGQLVVRPIVHLPAALRATAFEVFHQGDFTFFNPQLSAIRNHHATHPFPVTGITHSLDQPNIQHRFLQIALSGTAPYDAIVCTSDAAVRLVHHKIDEVHELLSGAGWSGPRPKIRTARIPLGLDDAAYAPPPGTPEHVNLRADARSHLGVSEDITVFLSVGRLSLRTKADWAPVLERVAELRERGEFQRCLLLIAGGGSGHKLLQEIIDTLSLGDCVALYPNFPDAMKPRLFAAADVYLSLVDNYQETFGINIVEAMAAGLPVIASDFDGYRDAVRDGLNGWSIPTIASIELPTFAHDIYGLLDPGLARFYTAQMVAVDLDAFAKALAESRIPERRRTVAVNARQTAERYRWRRIIAEYEALWAELSALARSQTTPNVGPPPALLGGLGLNAFAHYPSQVLSSNAAISITATGRKILENPATAFRYDDLRAVVDPATERALLEALVSGPKTLGELRAVSPDAGFLVAWLLKHGAVIARQ